MMKFTDSHCHLDFVEFNTHLSALLNQCSDNNIHRIIVPSVNPKHWQRVLSLPEQAAKLSIKKLANTPVEIYCCLGIHPWFLILKDNLSAKESSPNNLSLAFNHQSLKRTIIDN